MAALPEARGFELTDLRRLQAHELDPLLDSEARNWRDLLDWDFSASADLVRRFVRIQALSGYALRIGGRVCGYSYYVCEERKALVGDLYVLPEAGGAYEENLLLGAVLRDLIRVPYLARIEAQLMMMRGGLDRSLPGNAHLHVFPRNFMLAGLAEMGALPSRADGRLFQIAAWSEQEHDRAANLISSAYRGHVDARINDQYRSPAGARRFLTNIVQYPGCGCFHPDASFVAVDRGAALLGLSLASLVSNSVGHITQICVAPEARRKGIGYELLRHSLARLGARGCACVSLTVTAANSAAIELYDSIGFRTVKQFPACVWEGF